MFFTLLKVTVLLLIVDCKATPKASAKTGQQLPDLPYGHEICTLKADEGRCKAFSRRYFYNLFTRKCEEFIYGGCGGNENNFETKKQCLAKCKVKVQKYPHLTDRRSPCRMDADSGPCRGLFTRYFYNKLTKQCEDFIYGGCLGNLNNFRTEKDCQNVCHKTKLLRSALPTLCKAPADRGNCTESITKYFYNNSIDNCETFNYSGCGGNMNKFNTKQLCRRTCRRGARRQ
ncbi:tissue factor pathway inhibitor-like isoform X2 [Scyliorhinus canicula]|uniref:tissue factor pathway inhibitor-like isoform X2 n=1 Tax=Scyliorhinus canicula TaxID=7830 RepID=UPI0018F49493|nr:tissue factor pathway inhibitor-like isoform X2 [Scyliorhinus canicula]